MEKLKHILSVDQFTNDHIKEVFTRTREMAQMVTRYHSSDRLRRRVLACLFYEPSTRTSSSFIAAMTRLGGSVIPITQGVQFSSVTKGETLEDTIMTLGQYADAIVLRHPEMGAAARAAEVSPVPVINAGDGIGEHPTQALLDLYTIAAERESLDGLSVAFVGDLKNGRTVHSLLKLLSRYKLRSLYLVAPLSLRLPDEYRDLLPKDIPVVLTSRFSDALEYADVFYITRVQKERFANEESYAAVKDSCNLTLPMVQSMKPDAMILHPLPRVSEIDKAIDQDPRARYFTQVQNGLYVRMALLSMVMDGLLGGEALEAGGVDGKLRNRPQDLLV
jgi:carbamoyl-phosphate synthase/aspartate carbamoyltransferase/dihydroorotase/carbamoyl-phosphate synthase/aspartate carbamoyltransferase